MIVTGYKYDNEDAAILARKQCADHYGLPKTPDDTTLYWVNYQFAELNEPTFWFIVYDESIFNILGEPIEFDVVINNPL
jgi:hypothetical protein